MAQPGILGSTWDGILRYEYGLAIPTCETTESTPLRLPLDDTLYADSDRRLFTRLSRPRLPPTEFHRFTNTFYTTTEFISKGWCGGWTWAATRHDACSI